jgi:DNA polymerase-1
VSDPRELVLIDGSSLAYRAFFALPETIATSKGEPTNALLGFAQMLTRLITEYGTRPTIVAWDRGYSGRKEEYPEYKAGRASRPDALKEQWPHLEGLAAAFGHLNASVEGFEADDVIATLAEQAKADGIKVTIVTGDRDALQLVDEGVTVLATGRGVTDVKEYDSDGVVERYGVTPDLVPDLIGLKGDSSDNLPGVPGIGEKTAAVLLQEYGSLESVLAHVDEVKGPKRQEALREHAGAARMCRDIATAQRDLDLDVEPRDAPGGAPDPELLRETMRRWEMREPLRRLEKHLGFEASPEPEAETRKIESIKLDVVESDSTGIGGSIGSETVAVAVGGDEAPEGALFGDEAGLRFAVAFEDGRVITGGVDSAEDFVAELGSINVIAHDAKSIGVVPEGLVHDTMIGAHLLEPGRRGYPIEELAAEAGLALKEEDPLVREAAFALALAASQRSELSDIGMESLFDDVELPAIAVLRQMEMAGIEIDLVKLAEIAEKVRKQAAKLEKEIHKLAGEEFTVGSPQQVSGILFDKLGLTKGRKGKTGYSTDARVLQGIRSEHPIVPLIEEWRETTKLISTYLDALPKLVDPADGRIHTTYHQAATATGRLSSTDPNLQNIPVRTDRGKEIRACFVAPEGKVLVSCDYSQVELRILAHLANDTAMKRIFSAGEDVHTATAAEIFEIDPSAVDGALRGKAKMVNYGIVYGLSAFGLADRLDIPQSEAKEFIERYFAGFPDLKAFMDGAVEVAEEKGYAETVLGRRRPIPELKARNPQVRQLGARLAVNTVVQGTAADIMKLGMIRCAKALEDSDLKTRLLLQVHDELLLEAPQDEADAAAALATEAMVGAFELEPPLVVDSGYGPDWLNAK